MRGEEHVRIKSTDGVELEARFMLGTSGGSQSQKRRFTCAVITHPYGPLGGNLENNVVQEVYESLSRQGLSVVRFNFRGVSPSTGRTSLRGQGEREDVKSVCQYIQDKYGTQEAAMNFILVGYSYGALCTLSCISDIPNIIALVGISYPYSVSWFLTLFNSSSFILPLSDPKYAVIPKLFIMGTRDNFTSISSFNKFMDRINPDQDNSVESVIVENMDHFWFHHETKIINYINEFLEKYALL